MSRIYRSHKGKRIDMESMRAQHEKEIAMGNMGTNANGDVLGKGGKIVEPANSRARRKTPVQTKVSNTSLKDPVGEAELFPDDSKKTKTKATKRKSKKVEKETESGDIIMEEENKDED